MKLSMAYWANEENMSEASPLLAIQRGEKVVMPPALWIQAKNDLIHDYLHPNTRHQGVVDDHGNCSGACDGICNGGILTL